MKMHVQYIDIIVFGLLKHQPIGGTLLEGARPPVPPAGYGSAMIHFRKNGLLHAYDAFLQ